VKENNIENRIVRKVHSIKILLDNRTSRSCNAYHNVGGNAEKFNKKMGNRSHSSKLLKIQYFIHS